MRVLPRAALTTLKPTSHGGLDYAALRASGISPEEVVDFSVSVNPFGPSPAVRRVIARAAVARYPDTHAGRLREGLAALNGVEPRQVLAVNGLSQAIRLLALAYLGPSDLALILAPTFGEYQVACELMAAKVESWWSQAKDGFRPDVEAIARWIRARHPRMVWLCNPNNPTGLYLTKGEVRPLLDACMDIGGLLVIDEAYVNFVASVWAPTKLLESGHLVLLRSMTKDYALAGLRLGYVLAPPDVIGTLSKAQPPWSVNAVAQEAGRAALVSGAYYRDTWHTLRSLTHMLRRALMALGLEILPTDTNFMLLRVGDGAQLSRALWAQHRLLVRGCASFGLPAYIRVGTRLEKDNQCLLSGVQNFLSG